MIILTGGGGMIGSMIAWHLNTQMNFDDFVIVDDLINEQQENNFKKRKFIEYIAKDDLEKYLNDKKNVLSSHTHLMGKVYRVLTHCRYNQPSHHHKLPPSLHK